MEECAWLEAVLDKHGYERSISRVLNVKMESAVPKGNNFASLIYRATLDVLLRSGNRRKLTFIVKKQHVDKGTLEILEGLNLFRCEIKCYTEVLTKFEQLMDEYQDSSDKLWGSLIGCKPYNMIVFEDLKRTNFRMADRKKFLDKNHTLLVLTSLGRFHALGYALLKRGTLKKEDFLPYYLVAENVIFTPKMIKSGTNTLCQVMESDWSPDWKQARERLNKQQDVVCDKLKKLFIAPENAFQTVCHGDCWTCNMMFKYCPYDDSIPIAVKFLDFQTPHVNSYGFDLAYFLYVSVIPDIRRTQWDELLSVYQRSLSDSLKLYGVTDPAPTLPQIKDELKRVEYYSLVVNTVYLPVISSDVEGALVMGKLASDKEASSAFNPEIFKSDVFKDAVQYELKQWFKQGLY